MSEQKRVPLQSLGTTKKEKKGEEFVQSYRFSLTLPESNEQACPEFNYRELLKSAEKKRKKENKKGDENNVVNGLDPHDDDDDDKFREMAKRFEAKYGTGTAGRKKHNKYDDYVDLGAGYDETDSFIDNTDAYDEIVPEEMTTVRGGFYINSGALEFKTSEGNPVIGNHNNNNNNEDESSESSEEELEEEGSPKQSKKRALSTSEEEELEENVTEYPLKKPKMDDNGEKNSSNDGALKKKKKQELSILNRQKNTIVRDLLRVKREVREADLPADLEDRKKAEKSELTKPKSNSEKKFDIKRFEKKASSNGMEVKSKSETKKIAFYDDTIESVVNAARVEDQSSSDTMDSGKSRSIVCSNSDCDDAMDKEESPLPDALREDMREIINKLKAHAETTKEGKTKFFNGPVISYLLSLEKALRIKYPASVRLQTYDHLVHYLPCSKPTLLNRAKKIYLQDVEDRVKTPLERLKAAIDKIMPSVMVKYTRDCHRVADDKGIEGSPTDPDSSDADDSGNKSSEKSKIPQRRFPWTDETKKLVAEIASARREYFEILKPRKETVETFVSTFMDAKVRPLWPPGWIRLQTLLKYANPQLQGKRKLKKLKDGSATPGISAVVMGSSVQSSNVKMDSNIVNNDERVRTETSSIKENSVMNYSTSNKSNEVNAVQGSHSDKKSVSKSKETKTQEILASSQYNSTSGTTTNSGVSKISVVPTANLMPNKSKADKFNPMDLTSSSLSITPVNDYHKSGKLGESKELKKEDTISITACAEGGQDGVTTVSQSGNTSSNQTLGIYMPSLNQEASVISSIPKPVSLKHRILQESLDVRQEEKVGTEHVPSTDSHKTDRKERKEKRAESSRHKSHHDSKKRRKEHKSHEHADSHKVETTLPAIQSSISKEDQDETVAATNFLSQIEPSVLDEPTGNMITPSEQENDVQKVMRALKELEELQEMKYSPCHSPVSVIQKPSKSSTNTQYVNYQDDYQHLYHKKDDKIRTQKKEDNQW
ncbi:ubinuclein-1 isoform X2 [Athalia rosae]|uniref:ubinuclein-1 isoform X2 n=1 Tax=Athalia rosae TaxID=37344 RepID=UPI002033FB59|nr:ubinuclein-1 isoform X2 [Athalia rosae]